jgi:hypothetical protein
MECPGYGAECQIFHLHGELRDYAGDDSRNVLKVVALLHGSWLKDLFNCLRFIVFFITLLFLCYFMISLFHIDLVFFL